MGGGTVRYGRNTEAGGGDQCVGAAGREALLGARTEAQCARH